MNRNVWPVAAVLGGITAALAAARPAPAAAPAGVGLAVVKTFRLGGSDRWDYVTVDPAAHRLYVVPRARASRAARGIL